VSSVEIVYEVNLTDGIEVDVPLATLEQRMQLLIMEALDDLGLAIESAAKEKAGFKTGNLRRNITRTRAAFDATGAISAEVGVARTAPYGVWHHEGTGIFGKYKTRITPTAGNVLAWRDASVGGRMLFAKSVKGQKANPFMRDAYLLVKNTLADARMRKLAHDIGNLR
jgi:hypothetical protein